MKQYSVEFKVKAVEEYLKHDLTSTEVCEKLNVSSGSLMAWQRQYKEGRLSTRFAYSVPSKPENLIGVDNIIKGIQQSIVLKKREYKAVKDKVKQVERELLQLDGMRAACEYSMKEYN